MHSFLRKKRNIIIIGLLLLFVILGLRHFYYKANASYIKFNNIDIIGIKVHTRNDYDFETADKEKIKTIVSYLNSEEYYFKNKPIIRESSPEEWVCLEGKDDKSGGSILIHEDNIVLYGNDTYYCRLSFMSRLEKLCRKLGK